MIVQLNELQWDHLPVAGIFTDLSNPPSGCNFTGQTIEVCNLNAGRNREEFFGPWSFLTVDTYTQFSKKTGTPE